MQKLYKALLNKNTQRFFITLGIIVWWGLWYNRVYKYGGGISSFGTPYKLLLWVPIAVLLSHAIFLKFFTWLTTLITFILIAIGITKRLFDDFSFYHGSAVKDYMNTSESFIEIGTFMLCALIVGFLFWKTLPALHDLS